MAPVFPAYLGAQLREELWVTLRSEVARYNQIGQSCVAAVRGLHVRKLSR